MNQLVPQSTIGLLMAAMIRFPEKREQFIQETRSLPKRDLLKLQYCWPVWARPDQLAPPVPTGRKSWRCWMLNGGRGSGKTRAGAEWVISRVKRGAKRIALIAQTEDDGRKVMVEGESGILACSPPWNKPEYEPDNKVVRWRNGARADLYSGDSPGQLRGPQHDTSWCDETAKWKYPAETYAMMDLGLRLRASGLIPQCLITTTPRNLAFLRSLINHKATVARTVSTYANLANLDPAFIQSIFERYKGTRLGEQEIFGKVLEDVLGALWTMKMIDDSRLLSLDSQGNKIKMPNMRRLVVAIDPQAVTPREDSEMEGEGPETGIVMAGLGTDGHGYVMADASDDYSPRDWADKAVSLYKKYRADMIVAERNNGGEMVAECIRGIDPNVPVKLVWASRGKITRAEPVAAFYEQSRVHHIANFASMEDEMTHYTGDKKERSPNRMDALVWALTELMVKPEESTPHFDSTRHLVKLRKTQFVSEYAKAA